MREAEKRLFFAQAGLDYAAEPALGVVERHGAAIELAAKSFGVPAAMLRAVMLREQEAVDIADVLADQAVEWSLREDSSTGLMQIFGKTAIRAINEAAKENPAVRRLLGLPGRKPLDAQDEDDLGAVWERLHEDPAFCVAVGALNLLSCARETVGRTDFQGFSREELKKTFARYNGFGDDALCYGEDCCRRYEAFVSLAHDDELVDRE